MFPNMHSLRDMIAIEMIPLLWEIAKDLDGEIDSIYDTHPELGKRFADDP